MRKRTKFNNCDVLYTLNVFLRSSNIGIFAAKDNTILFFNAEGNTHDISSGQTQKTLSEVRRELLLSIVRLSSMERVDWYTYSKSCRR